VSIWGRRGAARYFWRRDDFAVPAQFHSVGSREGLSPKNRPKEATPMPVLMIAEQPNPVGGIRIIEIWESKVDQQKFFNEHLGPNLPPGLVPDLTYYELHAAFTR
jgi:hypothetical protein